MGIEENLRQVEEGRLAVTSALPYVIMQLYVDDLPYFRLGTVNHKRLLFDFLTKCSSSDRDFHFGVTGFGRASVVGERYRVVGMGYGKTAYPTKKEFQIFADSEGLGFKPHKEHLDEIQLLVPDWNLVLADRKTFRNP